MNDTLYINIPSKHYKNFLIFLRKYLFDKLTPENLVVIYYSVNG